MTAILNGIRWYFGECTSCYGKGTKGHVECRHCRGTGYLRTTQPNQAPTRNGGLHKPK